LFTNAEFVAVGEKNKFGKEAEIAAAEEAKKATKLKPNIYQDK
jgi:hypothetical protein